MEQASTTTTAVVATSISVYGVATGVNYEVLIAGVAGGLVSLSFLPEMGLWQRLWTPFAATLTAGYTAPVGAHYLSSMLAGAPAQPMLVSCAFAVGVLTQFLIPITVRRLRRWAEGQPGTLE